MIVLELLAVSLYFISLVRVGKGKTYMCAVLSSRGNVTKGGGCHVSRNFHVEAEWTKNCHIWPSNQKISPNFGTFNTHSSRSPISVGLKKNISENEVLFPVLPSGFASGNIHGR